MVAEEERRSTLFLPPQRFDTAKTHFF
jgi:hypothetical protein